MVRGSSVSPTDFALLSYYPTFTTTNYLKPLLKSKKYDGKYDEKKHDGHRAFSVRKPQFAYTVVHKHTCLSLIGNLPDEDLLGLR